MKPIPPGYSEAADNAPIPGRPWWHVKYGGVARASIPPQHAVSGFCRSDGAFVPHETWQVRGESLDFPDSVAAYDAAHPLPHPGYRAGQVWLYPDGSTTTLLCVGGADPVGFDPLVWKYAEDGDTVTILNLTGCWLLHDPLMPSRAPWGPA